jgi:hypothetical protein
MHEFGDVPISEGHRATGPGSGHIVSHRGTGAIVGFLQKLEKTPAPVGGGAPSLNQMAIIAREIYSDMLTK